MKSVRFDSEVSCVRRLNGEVSSVGLNSKISSVGLDCEGSNV